MLRPIKNKKEYQKALELAYDLMQKKHKKGSIKADRLEVLSILIEQYEAKRFPIDPPHPIEAIHFRLEQMNLDRSDLNKILGNRSRTSEVLSGKRKLSLSMIRKLNESLGIPAEILIRDYKRISA